MTTPKIRDAMWRAGQDPGTNLMANNKVLYSKDPWGPLPYKMPSGSPMPSAGGSATPRPTGMFAAPPDPRPPLRYRQEANRLRTTLADPNIGDPQRARIEQRMKFKGYETEGPANYQGPINVRPNAPQTADLSGDMVRADDGAFNGGTPNFDENTGQYAPPPSAPPMPAPPPPPVAGGGSAPPDQANLAAQRQRTMRAIQARGGATNAPGYSSRLDQINSQVRDAQGGPDPARQAARQQYLRRMGRV